MMNKNGAGPEIKQDYNAVIKAAKRTKRTSE
ncbi:hypothetical protein BH11BAC6_BH11BAC6_16280 [soil metagenome]